MGSGLRLLRVEGIFVPTLYIIKKIVYIFMSILMRWFCVKKVKIVFWVHTFELRQVFLSP